MVAPPDKHYLRSAQNPPASDKNFADMDENLPCYLNPLMTLKVLRLVALKAGPGLRQVLRRGGACRTGTLFNDLLISLRPESRLVPFRS